MTPGWQKSGLLALALFMAGAMACEATLAAGHGGSGRGGRSGGHHGGHHGGKNHAGGHQHTGRSVAAFGAIAAPAYWTWWNYPSYYPVVAMAPAPPVEYIERAEQEAQPEEYWLYCAKAQGYFPYVGECAEGWERVPTTPPKQDGGEG